MKIPRADGGEKFILYKFQMFYEKRSILIKYGAPYMYKKNRLAKQRWRIIITIKDSMLINSGLSNGFFAKVMEITKCPKNRLLTRNRTYGEIIPEKT